MKDRDSMKLNILTVLVVIMLAALAAQSVALYKMSGSSDVVKEESRKSEQEPAPAVVKSTPVPLRERNSLFDDSPFDFDLDNWDPFREMQYMNERIDRMFGSAFNRFRESDGFSDLFERHGFSPDLNIEEREGDYVITMDLPGADDSCVNIDLQGQTLTVSGSSDMSSKSEKEGKVIMQERRIGKFKRSVELPGPVKSDEMQSATENGVLRITIPKSD
jgi:HSP20 family protein